MKAPRSTVAGYRDTGGVRGAVARSAEEVYAAISADERNALRSLMLRLVSPGSEGEPRRARVPAAQLADDRHADLIESLVNSRLVTSDAGELTLTHEALVDGWPRLREWLDEDVEGRRLFHHLTVASRAWDELGRPDSELYRGVRLARALAWAETTTVALSATETAFLDAGRACADAEAASLVDQIRRQARANRRLRALLVGVAVLLVAAMVAGGLADRAPAAGPIVRRSPQLRRPSAPERSTPGIRSSRSSWRLRATRSPPVRRPNGTCRPRSRNGPS